MVIFTRCRHSDILSFEGGQNVNKVETKVELKIPLDDQLTKMWLPDVLCDRLAEMYKSKLNKQRELSIVSQRHRTQAANMKDAFEKLQVMLEEANTKPIERIETEVPEWSKKKRLQDKKKHSNKKSLRKFLD